MHDNEGICAAWAKLLKQEHLILYKDLLPYVMFVLALISCIYDYI